MAGETIKTRAVCLKIHPWSRTSHVVTWLTPEAGPVTTLVKGACRPKSAFLGQYDLYYTCELVYYVRATGEIHQIRECVPVNLREHLRGDWRRTAYAGYAAYLAEEHCPHGADASEWFAFLEAALDRPADIVWLEKRFLGLSGLTPDLSGWHEGAEWMSFALDRGRIGEDGKTVRLSAEVRNALQASGTGSWSIETVRFLGMFLRFHVDVPPDLRREAVRACGI